MLSAPRGVTRIAGANAYAAKLAISPTITVPVDKTHQYPALNYKRKNSPTYTRDH